MTGEVDLVVTDLDGTLWDTRERIHDRTMAALEALARRRMPLLVATGRRPRSAATALARSGLRPPAVLLDGAIGRFLSGGGDFHASTFQPAAAAAVLAAYRSVGMEPVVYLERGDTDVAVGTDPSTHPTHLEMLRPWAVTTDLEQVVASVPIYALGVVGRDPARLAEVTDAVGDEAAAVVTRDVMLGGATLMVRPHGTSKWEGVLAYCRAHDIDPGRVLAVGDGENDLELLAGASVACVVSDGCDAALQLADHVFEPACDGGWSAVLDLL